MKIVRLNLSAFGPFTGQTLDFSGCESNLHIVYGPNEAGKSSALRALINWLYGIPMQTPDNFLHSYQNLRIGGVLEAADGTRLEFIRRKGRTNTLRGPDDAEVFDEARLQKLLGGVDESTFKQRFGINHEELRRGGEAVVSGGGDLAEILFAAGAGAADLHAIQEQLQAEAEALFKARGSKQKISQALAELKAARDAIRKAQLPTSKWLEHDKALRRAQKRQHEIEKELSEKRAEHSRLDRARRSLPLIGRLKQMQNDLALLADAPLLPDTFCADRRETETRLATAEGDKREAQREIERLTELLAQVTVPEELLQHRTAITQLHTELGSYRKAAKERPGLVVRREQAEKRASEILQQLGRPPHLAEAEKLKLPKRQRQRIQELAGQCQALVQQQQSAEKTLGKLDREIEQIEQAIEALPPRRDVSELERAIGRARKRGDLDEQRREVETELQKLRRQAEVQLAQLSLFDGTLDALERLSVPAAETIDRFENALGDARQEVHRLEERIDELTGECRKLEKKLDALQLEQDVPTEADLLEARQQRDAGWELVQQAWQAGSSGERAVGDDRDAAVAAFIDNFAPGGDLAAAYRASVEAADAIADRLRREADRVAQKAKLTADLRETEQKLAEFNEQLRQAKHKLQAEQDRWVGLWKEVGIDPLSPREMLSWRNQQQELVRLASEIRGRESDLVGLDEQIDAYRDELNNCVHRIDPDASPFADDVPLSVMLDRCEQLVECVRNANAQRENLMSKRAELASRVADARQQAEEASRQLEDWQQQWAEAVAALGLDADATPSDANAVIEEVDELLSLVEEIRELDQRIHGIDRDAEEFERRVRQVLDQVAGDLLETLDTSVEQAVTDLADRLRNAEKDEERVKAWQEQLEKQRATMQKAALTIEQSRQTLEQLCKQAGCSSSEELPEAEERSARKKEIQAELKQLEQKLVELAAGTRLAEWIETVEQLDPDQLDADLKRLDDEIAGLEEEKKTVAETIGEHRNELARMDGSGVAADAQVKAEHLLAEIRNHAEQYIRLRLASEVLARAMERFREASQGPVLDRAGALFSELTLGSFSSLRADFDAQGKSVLVGVRPNGQTVTVEGMSEGTCDQLYLAVRLALLESSLAGREPMPLIVDDILITFDDHRAVAALKALMELSTRTQVIFFTHHKHLVQLAQAELAPTPPCLHQLGT